MVFVGAADTKLFPHAPETRHRNWFRNLGVANANREFDVSWLSLRWPCVGIEPANQHVPVFLCACGQVRNKGLHQISICFFQGWCAAEIGGVSLDEGGIEIVLPDQQTELIPQTRLSMARTVAGVIRRGSMIRRGATIGGERPEFLDRAEANAVRLSKGAVDRPRFGDAHLSAVNHEGNIGWISVAVANEPLRTGRLVDRCFEYPATGSDIRKAFL